jgi:hypothetical protein
MDEEMSMTERPILFSAPMVRALLAGTKTQTRRAVRLTQDQQNWLRDPFLYLQPMYGTSPPPNPVEFGTRGLWRIAGPDYPDGEEDNVWCDYGAPGDRLWVRENGWERPERTPKMMREGADTWAPYYYDADGITPQEAADFKAWGFKRRPSIHMPRHASRILLEVTGVRVERLQAISEKDAAAEGWPEPPPDGTPHPSPRAWYTGVWAGLNGLDSWHANPWVWVVEFRRAQP